MPLRSDWTTEHCPIARSLEVLGDPWVLLVLRQAFSGVRRYEQFRAELGIADNVLSNRLGRLVDADLLRRAPYHDHQRVRYEYVLTDAGRAQREGLHAQWDAFLHAAEALGRPATATPDRTASALR